ncbi:MAG: hypothetical protein ACK40O_11995 [Allosphingosinicella sp.]
MNLLCHAAGHRGLDREIYNGGYFFARCARCKTDFIRDGRGWRAVPQGHRVVWKTGRHSHSLEPDYAHALPILASSGEPAARAPARRRARRGALVPVPPPNDAARAVEDEREPELPGFILFIAAVAGAAGALRFLTRTGHPG